MAHQLQRPCQLAFSSSWRLPYPWQYPARACAAPPHLPRRRAPSMPAALQRPLHRAHSLTRDQAHSPRLRRSSRVEGAMIATRDSLRLASAVSNAHCLDYHAPAWTSRVCATPSTLSPPRRAPLAARLAIRNGRAFCLARQPQEASVPVVQSGQARVQQVLLQLARADEWRREPHRFLGHSHPKERA